MHTHTERTLGHVHTACVNAGETCFLIKGACIRACQLTLAKLPVIIVCLASGGSLTWVRSVKNNLLFTGHLCGFLHCSQQTCMKDVRLSAGAELQTDTYSSGDLGRLHYLEPLSIVLCNKILRDCRRNLHQTHARLRLRQTAKHL